MTTVTQSAKARAKARANGLPTYQGKPCPHGHATRYVSNRQCVDCAKRQRGEQTQREKAARDE